MKKWLFVLVFVLLMGVVLLPESAKKQNTALVIECSAEIEKTATILAAGTTYYIRTDGGTCTQCTGTTDAPYPGSGSNQPCAWSHPFWALDSDGNWKIQGGDTIIIAAGSYMMGLGAPNTSGWCEADYAYDCDLPPLPSGPDSNHPTRILGKGWDSGCPNPPELWGTQRIWNVLDLTGSSNVYIGCLEITDHSSCVEDHSNPAAECERDNYPFGQWASEGIIASDSANVTLKYLDIHGLGSTGIRAGRISDWTVEDVRVAGNGWVGWEGDLTDENDSNSGTLRFKRFVVEWNGCGETYPGLQPHNCWAQTAGGYGDGFGTGATGGHWIFEDCIFRYNTSDGLDLLYARKSGSKIDIKRTQAYGNAGNPIKVNGPTAIENSLMIANCGYFNGKSFTYNVDNCRAGGNALELSLRNGTTSSVVNSTIVGQGDCLVAVTCDDEAVCGGSEKVIIQNNIFLGYDEFGSSSDTTCYIWFDRDNFYTTQLDYNIIYDAKIGAVGYSSHDLNKDPLFVNDSLASFNGHLQSGSPAINSGLAVGSLNGLIPANDIEGNSRPVGSGVDRGAYEYGSITAAGQIALNRTNLYFGASGNEGTNPQTFQVSNSGTGTMNWSAASTKSWLSCSPTSGTNSGLVTVTVDASGLAPGTYTGAVTVSSANASNSPQSVNVTFNVYASGGSSGPFGVFSTPIHGTTVSSSVPVTGWALDDVEVENVKIYREDAGNLVYIGDALFVVGARPDVEQSFPEFPYNYRAGWGYMMLTNFLPNGGNGTFTFHAIASDVEGNAVTLGTKTITLDNANAVKPFGAIDTPIQGGTASGGDFRNHGWVLTPMPNSVPVDGSTIAVYVDGVNLGHPVYNIYRSDIAELFPDYANSDGAHGYFDFDTTAYTDGVHTIAWAATDDAGNVDGIGSRYFNIQNSNGGGRGNPLWLPIPAARGAVKEEIVTVEIRELGRVKIEVGEPNAGKGVRYCGFHIVGDRLKPLPVGSTLDGEKGIFYWQPGPGFVGDYRLVFYIKGKNGDVREKTRVIRIMPKF